MSNDLPVGRTISSAYNFAFSNFLSILGIVWLPYAALAAVAVALVLLAVPDMPHMFMTGDLDVPALMRLGRIIGLLSLLAFLVGCMITVGLQRKALGREPRPVYFYFSLGAPVWRMAASFFVAGLVIAVIALLAGGACVAIWFAAAHLPGAIWAVRILAILAAIGFVLFVAIRLFFFLPAIVVAEETIGLERAWTLSGGNFWRIFFIWTAVFVPVVVAFWIISRAVLGPFGAMPGLGGPMTMHEILRSTLLQFRVVAPLFLVVQFAERLVLLGLLNGAVASAYLALTGTSPAASASAPPTPPMPAA